MGPVELHPWLALFWRTMTRFQHPLRPLVRAGLLALAASAAALPQVTHLSSRMILVEPNPGQRVFALNSSRGIVVIDTTSAVAIVRPLKDAIEREFQRNDYAFVINTHDHPEHFGGNALFQPEWIIAQEGIARGLAEMKTQAPVYIADGAKYIAALEETLPALQKESPDYRETLRKIAGRRAFIEQVKTGFVPPNLTFRDRMTLDLGDCRVVLISVGKSHSYSDTFVYVPEDGILLTGGRGHLGFIPPGIGSLAEAADMTRLISVLSEFVDSDAELRHIISGHSAPVTKADLRFIRDYYRVLHDGIKQAKAAGQTLGEAKRAFSLESKFSGYPRLSNPTGDMVARHERNIDDLWRMW
jgi:cyclase